MSAKLEPRCCHLPPHFAVDVPELEPPAEVAPLGVEGELLLEPLDAAVDELVEVPQESLVDDVLSLFAGVEEGSPPLPFGVEEYKSAYQPPPFRMKFPPEIWRLAVLFVHLGQISMGSAEIF